MSMEVKKNGEWSNVKKLIALRWRNGNFVRELLSFFGVALLLDLFLLISTWMSGGDHVGDWINIEKYGTIENTLLIIYIARVLFRMGSVLREDGVSMYPGTVRTRYISRILSDCLVLAVFVAADTILNLLVTGGYMLMAKVTGNYGEVLIIGNYGWLVVLTFFGVFAIYSVLLFLQTLYERVGALRFCMGTLVVIAALLVELKTSIGVVGVCIGLVHHFIWGGENVPVRILLFMFVVFVVCMLLSFLLVRGIRSWKKEKTYGGVVLCFVTLLTLCFFFFIGVVDTNKEERRYSSEHTLEEKIEKGEYFAEDSKQKLVIDHTVRKELDHNMSTEYNIQWVSLEDAKRAGIVDENTSLEPNEICIRTVVKNSEVQGTSLTKGFLNAKLTVENGSYQVKEPLRVVLRNNYLSVFQYFCLSNKEQQELEDVQDYDLARYLGYFILYNKEDVKEGDVPMSCSAGSALDEFIWEIEE